ncbi:MAG TPA: type II toxin-antitoxin system RelE/ParE family toxin [Thermomicrobiales bacterium]|nr:type II toxin-antitoxin system RelE/ParE family toxin [Thermomicrobiales bacterium]
MWKVLFTDEALEELDALPKREQVAIAAAVLKLEAMGPNLSAPHSSNIQGIDFVLRELRPRRGDCPWRAFYVRHGKGFLICSVGPEARQDRRRFDRAVRLAGQRMLEYE